MENLFSSGEAAAGEIFETLLKTPGFRVERIVSNGEPSPEGFWYDQPEAEWVSLLSGTAVLEIQGEGRRHLKAGDWLVLPAHLRHRVAEVSSDAIWLAIHYHEPS